MPDTSPAPPGEGADGGDATPPKESSVDYAILLAPAIAAVIGGVIVAYRTGELWRLAVVAIGGTILGYVACLTVLFTVGHALEREGILRGRAVYVFFLLDMAVGVGVAIANAVLASTGADSR